MKVESQSHSVRVRAGRMAVAVALAALAVVGVVRLVPGLIHAPWSEYTKSIGGLVALALVVAVSIFNLLFWIGVPIIAGYFLLHGRRWVRTLLIAWAAMCVLAAVANSWDAVAIALVASVAAIVAWTPLVGLGRRRVPDVID